MLEQRQVSNQQWLDALSKEMERCSESSNPKVCVLQVGQMVYTHYNIDLHELAALKKNNIIASDSDEVRIMGHPIIGNFTDTVIQKFLADLGLDTHHLSNYEPAFVEALKQEHAQEFKNAVDWAQENNANINELGETVGDDILKDLIESPLLDLYFAPRE